MSVLYVFDNLYSIVGAAHGVTFVKYASILVQALTVQADEDFLYSLFDLTKVKGAPWDETQEE